MGTGAAEAESVGYLVLGDGRCFELIWFFRAVDGWMYVCHIYTIRRRTCLYSRSLPDDGSPAVINSDGRAVDLAGALSICHVHTEPCNLIHVDGRSLDGIEDTDHLLIAPHMHSLAKRIRDVGFHAAHHQSIALDALVAIVRSRALGQSDQTVLASRVGST